MRRSRRGIALVTVLLFSALVATMVYALLMSVRAEAFASQRHYQRTAAQYAAEAGVAEALARLELDPAWTGVDEAPLPAVRGSYTVRFRSSGPFGPLDSVNNLLGDAPVESYRGPATVPAGTILLIVRGRAYSTERVLETVVARSGNLQLETPLLTTGRILMQGDIDVSGVSRLDSREAFDIVVQSNTEEGPVAVRWTGDPGQACLVRGTVASVLESGSSLQMTGAEVTGGLQPGAVARPFPPLDVQRDLERNEGAPAPVITASGTTRLAPGDYYHSGDLTVPDGDLILDGANLYVGGTLTVNGSVKGHGSVFTGGAAKLRGDSSIASISDRVALFAHGSVELEGLDAHQYLEAVSAGDSGLQTLLAHLEASMDRMDHLLQEEPRRLVNGGDLKVEVDNVRRSLGQADSTGWPPGNPQNNLLGRLATHLEGKPATPGRDRVLAWVRETRKVFQADSDSTYGGTADGDANSAPVRLFMDANLADTTGLMDHVLDSGSVPAMVQLAPYLRDAVRYDELGSSSFQGLVYTNGYLAAVNHLRVVGAVLVKDDGSQENGAFRGVDLEPGDLYLANGARVLFVQEMLQDDRLFGGVGSLGVRTWTSR